eukprot:6386047-Amphidinium_carterae.2
MFQRGEVLSFADIQRGRNQRSAFNADTFGYWCCAVGWLRPIVQLCSRALLDELAVSPSITQSMRLVPGCLAITLCANAILHKFGRTNAFIAVPGHLSKLSCPPPSGVGGYPHNLLPATRAGNASAHL